MTLMDALAALIKLGFTALVGGLAGYFGSYLKRKGENAATHEDINKLTDQVRAVTTVTEQIKTQISGEAWNRERQWEIRRDVFLDAMRALGKMDAALLTLHSAYAVAAGAKPEEKETWIAHQQAALDEARSAKSAFDSAIALVPLICRRSDAMVGFPKLSGLFGDAMRKILKSDLANYSQTSQERTQIIVRLEVAVRQELDMPLPEKGELIKLGRPV
jgi:hypothetical protein